MKEQYQKLSQLIERASDTKSFKLEEVLKEAVGFFDAIRLAYVKAGPEEKQELLQMMNGLYKRLQDSSKQIGEKTGMSEESVREYAENPSNFSKDQWEFLQESKDKLHHSVRKFSAAMQDKTPGKTAKERPRSKIKPAKRRNWA